MIISSGAAGQIELRTPYEVANLGLLFGLSEEQGKRAMAGNCRQVVVRALGRRHNKAVMTVEVAKDDKEEDTEDELMDTDGEEEEEEEEQPVKKLKMNQ